MKTALVLFVTSAVALTASISQAQTNNDPAATACQSTGLIALKQRSHDITDRVLTWKLSLSVPQARKSKMSP